MAIWMIRAGAHGEYEQKFLQESRFYATSDGLSKNLALLKDREELITALKALHPEDKPKTILNWASQLWPFAKEIKKGDLIVFPLKAQRAINIGEVTGEYHFDKNAPDPFYHYIPVKWIGELIPRTNFGEDLLNSFGAFLTICRIKRNNAEARINAMRKNGWKKESDASVISDSSAESDVAEENLDLEEAGQDQIARLIEARFKGHDLTRLVDAILQAKGYTTYRSPEGPDGGIDILAGAGPLGFGNPRLCVEVKSGRSPIDRETVDKLMGAATKCGAPEALFVSWSGFKTTVQKELAPQFFKVRLWSQPDLLKELFENYDKLDEDLKAELPLKRIWTVATKDEE